MRLYEIPDYLNKKITNKTYNSGSYIYFKNGVWFNQNESVVSFSRYEPEDDGWIEYIEPKEVKRYWKWIATTPDGSLVECNDYLDANAISAEGAQYFSSIVKSKKWKISSMWVDVDSDGNIVDCSESLK
jgi:hypothetical protein